jgi:hypothetical protein
MEVHVSAELPNGREEWSSNGVTRLIPDSSTFTELFGQTLGEFCSTFANGLDPVNRQSSNFKLDSVEMYIELTSNGEIRLVASAGTEVAGAIKLTFKTKDSGDGRPPLLPQ